MGGGVEKPERKRRARNLVNRKETTELQYAAEQSILKRPASHIFLSHGIVKPPHCKHSYAIAIIGFVAAAGFASHDAETWEQRAR